MAYLFGDDEEEEDTCLMKYDDKTVRHNTVPYVVPIICNISIYVSMYGCDNAIMCNAPVD